MLRFRPSSLPRFAASDDGHFAPGSCNTPNLDCDDLDPTVFPGAPEICNGIDDNCDSAIDEGFDGDGDGYTICGADGVSGTSDDDCRDGSFAINPGVVEVCNGIDDDCDGDGPGGVDEGYDQDSDLQTSCAGDCTLEELVHGRSLRDIRDVVSCRPLPKWN